MIRTARSRLSNSRLAWGLVGVVAFLLLWQWAGTNANPIFFSTPTKIAGAVPDVFENGDLLSLYLDSMSVYARGLFLAVSIGVTVGIITGLNRRVRYIVDPLAVAFYSTPSIVLIPIFILWFGVGDQAKIALVLFSGTFPPLINTQLGVDQMGPQMRELARSFGANRREMLLKIVLPSIIPYSMAGIRLSVPRAFVSVIAAEMLITASGVGGLILQYGNQYQTTFYFVPVALIILTSYSMTELVKLLEKKLMPWSRTTPRRTK